MLKKLILSIGILLVSAQLSNAQIVINPPTVTFASLTSACTNGWVLYKSSGDPCEAALSYDAATNALRLNSQPLLTGVSDDANNSEPALMIYPASGNEASVLIASSFTDGLTWTGLWIDAFGNAANINSMINGSVADTSLGIRSGSGGLVLSATNGVVGISGTEIDLNQDTVLANGKALKTGTTTAHTALLQAYDVNAAAYSTACTLTNANAPSFNCTPVGDLTIDLTANDLHLTGTTQTLTGSEVTVPAAPSANGFKLFSQDSGGAKTQVCARFNSGAVQCFATEP